MTKTTSTLLAATTLAGALALVGCKRQVSEEPQTPGEVVVQVGKIVRATLRAHVEAYGTVEPDPGGGDTPAGAVKLTASVPGIVMVVSAKEGQIVGAGSVLVTLDDRVALASVQKAQHVLEFALKTVSREERLKAMDGTSEKAVQEASRQLAAAQDDLVAAQVQVSLMQLATPIAGTVSRVFVQPGQAVDSSIIVAEVIDQSRLVVAANIPGEASAMVKVGQPVELLIARAGAPAVAGTVAFLGPRIDPMTSTVLVRIAIPVDAGLLPGQLTRVRIVSEERADRLAVPISSLVKDGMGGGVIAIVENGKAVQKRVQVGLRERGLIEIVADGLSEGQTVVTVGAYGLPSGCQVRAEEK